MESELFYAQKIAAEINAAWAFPENNSELSKYGSMGYMAEIGSPHQWWEANCESYRDASEAIPQARKLHNICKVAQTLLDEWEDE